MQHIIITCDDCGMSEGINTAAAQLHEQGIATAASIITNLPATRHAFALFRHYPTMELGIHLNLTDGLPLTHIPRHSFLTDASGSFRPRGYLFTAALVPGSAYLAQIEEELTAQIETFLSTGAVPGHLTTHMHFHIVPSLRRIVLDLADRYTIPWVRSYHPQTSLMPYAGTVQRHLPPPEMPNNVTTIPDYLAGLYFWVGTSPERLSGHINRLGGTTEIVVHPGQQDDLSFPRTAAYAPHRRAAETRYLRRLFPLLAVS